MSIRNCMFFHIGCQFQGSGEEICNHEQDKSFHLIAALLRCENQKTELNKINDQLKLAEEQSEKWMKETAKWRKETAKWMTDYFKLKQSNELLEDECNKLKQKILKYGIEIEHLLEDDKTKSEGTTEVAKKKVEHKKGYVNRFANCIDKLNKMEKQIKDDVEQTLDDVKIDQKEAEKEKKCNHLELLEELKKQKEELTKRHLEVDSLKIEVENLTKFVSGHLSWNVQNISPLLEDLGLKRLESLFSEPFYTKPNGYKLCVRLGGTHFDAGIELCLMAGKNDDELQWPFRCKGRTRVIDQLNGTFHIEKTFSFQIKNKVRGMLCINDCYLCIPRFQLKNDIYLINDAIRINVDVTEY